VSHAKHGWPKTSFDDENNNRYQANAPLVVWCGRCRQLLPADEAWAKIAAWVDAEAERILLGKIQNWAGRQVTVVGARRDARGRIELEFEETPR
jgi:hypothetical protein